MREQLEVNGELSEGLGEVVEGVTEGRVESELSEGGRKIN